MLTNEEMIGLQAEKHDLVSVGEFKTAEEYVLYLMHCYAYKVTSGFARGRVLDLGCNVGYGSVKLASNGSQVFGVDVSESAINEAKKVNLQPGLSFSVIDGKNLPFPDDHFDLVVSCQVIEHIVDVTNYLSEISRVLKRKGLVAFTTPNRKIRLDDGMKPWNIFHVTEYDDTELKVMLSPYFSNCDIFGMFAEKSTYEVEFNRVQAVLRANRKRLAINLNQNNKSNEQFSVISRFERFFRHLLALILPTKIVSLLKGLSPNKRRNEEKLPESNKQFDPVNLEKYSIEDFFYSTGSLQNSLDLLAICSNCSESHEPVVTNIANSLHLLKHSSTL